ncbi:uncharacterized protein LOC134825501 [Bolinopsis microptera]|uniref:uncharacterized protein LOC134825501 n=1 Tax=Bolinopsis microptera TaxID=2820187 RepID=UPI00307A00F8
MLLERLFVLLLLVVVSHQNGGGCLPLSVDQLTKKLGNGFIPQHMSMDQNFDGNHPLQYNQHGICSSKLVFDQFPDSYFPRFIRHVKCDSEEDKCMTGKSCQTVDAYINILEKKATIFCDDDGYEQWTTVSLKIGAGCECAVETF